MPAAIASRGEPKVAGRPKTRISPSSWRYRPSSTFMSVDLPAPFSPSRAWTSPTRRSKSTSSLATTPGKRLTMPRSSTASGHASGVRRRVGVDEGHGRTRLRVCRWRSRSRPCEGHRGARAMISHGPRVGGYWEAGISPLMPSTSQFMQVVQLSWAALGNWSRSDCSSFSPAARISAPLLSLIGPRRRRNDRTRRPASWPTCP